MQTSNTIKIELDNWIVAVHNKEELKEAIDVLEIKEVELLNFPMIIYKGMNESVVISEIKKENLEKMSREKFERKTLWNFSSIKCGIAKKMQDAK